MTEGVLDIITACVVTHSDLGGSFQFSDCDLDPFHGCCWRNIKCRTRPPLNARSKPSIDRLPNKVQYETTKARRK